MNFAAKSTPIEQVKSDCLIIGVYSDGTLPPAAKALEKSLTPSIEALIKTKEITGALGQTVVIHQPSSQLKKLIVLGFGKPEELSTAKFRQAIGSLSTLIAKSNTKKIDLFLNDITVDGWQESDKAQYCAQKLTHGQYRFTRCKSDAKKKTPSPTLTYYSDKSSKPAAIKSALALGSAVGEGMNVARELGNLPGNICTPRYLAGEAKKLSRSYKSISTKVLSEKQMADLGMGSLLSVSAGSVEPAQLIVMEYKGAAKSEKPHVLVGKGITFDTGGISLKPGAGMDEMKFDMCGAASVFGTINTIARLEAKINLVAIVAAAENMPSGNATKPGDIVTTMSGKTVEILNTDAEGRLVLCDALSYAERYKPQSVVDIATLTGACVIALGSHATGLFSNNDELAGELLAAGEHTGDKAWQMPLWDEYKKSLKSNFADLANIGGREAGSVTAACFLSYFSESYPWAHLDIAGTAWLSGANKGATGRPVPLLTHYLLSKEKGK